MIKKISLIIEVAFTIGHTNYLHIVVARSPECIQPVSSITLALLQFCREQISRYKIPRYWKFVDAFPMTVTGKIRKTAMRETAIEEPGLQKVARIKHHEYY